MMDVNEFGDYKTAWCPGCGNFPLLKCLKQALANLDLHPHQLLVVSGIGQAAKAAHYINANIFNGLHGRFLPVATGAKLANPDLTVIAESGDGCTYGEGGNHFLAAIRRNIDITLIVHNNQVYGLTKGQASPTTDKGQFTPAQPGGVALTPFNPLAVAVALKAGFVARSFVGWEEHLIDMIEKAVTHNGFSLLDVLQPCVSFNHVNTYAWYNDRCKHLPAEYDPENWAKAIQMSEQWGEGIPVGVIYKNDTPPYEKNFPAIAEKPLVHSGVNRQTLKDTIERVYR
ncbi:MAG: 2-oxoacid:ferredoxin oxidoreductase subunit beta [Desulfobacterales bacterium]